MQPLSIGQRAWYLFISAVLITQLMACAAGSRPTNEQKPASKHALHAPTTIYIAGEFITMNPAQPRAEAVAVSNGRFVAVGSHDEVLATAGSNATIDTTFRDKTVIAGFIEQHVHPVLAALMMATDVIAIEDWETVTGYSPGVRNQAGYRERLQQAIASRARTPGTKPLISWGYHHYFHGKLSRQLLDSYAGELPVIIWHRSGHEFYLNSKALALVGIDETFTKKLPRAVQKQVALERGHFFEQGAAAILGKLTPVIAAPEQLMAGLHYTEAYYHKNGITLACEPGGFLDRNFQRAINAVYSDDATPFNHCFIVDGRILAQQYPDNPAALLAASEAVLDWSHGRTWHLPKQAKLFTDGAMFSQLMQMKDGYTDGHHGEWLMDPGLFDYAFQTYWDAGYQIHVHNNGDGGLELLLASLEKAMLRNPRDDHRTVIVHFGFAGSEQIARWAELGGIVSANPYYVTALAGHYALHGIGAPRAQNMVPLGDVVDAGMSFSFHSDMPMAPAKPLHLVWSATNRLTHEGQIAGPQHRVSVQDALKAVTIDAAYSIRQEQEVGSIEVGKQANLTILEQSPFAVAVEKIKNIKVWGTMLEGRVQPVTASTGHQ